MCMGLTEIFPFFRDTDELCINPRNVSLYTLYGGQFMFSTPLLTLNYLR